MRTRLDASAETWLVSAYISGGALPSLLAEHAGARWPSLHVVFRTPDSNCPVSPRSLSTRDLRALFESGVSLYEAADLHAKVFLFPAAALVGSANLTGPGLQLGGRSNVERGVPVGPSGLRDIREFVRRLDKVRVGLTRIDELEPDGSGPAPPPPQTVTQRAFARLERGGVIDRFEHCTHGFGHSAWRVWPGAKWPWGPRSVVLHAVHSDAEPGRGHHFTWSNGEAAGRALARTTRRHATRAQRLGRKLFGCLLIPTARQVDLAVGVPLVLARYEDLFFKGGVSASHVRRARTRLGRDLRPGPSGWTLALSGGMEGEVQPIDASGVSYLVRRPSLV